MADDMVEQIEIAIRQAINTHWDGMILTGGHELLARAVIEAITAAGLEVRSKEPVGNDYVTPPAKQMTLDEAKDVEIKRLSARVAELKGQDDTSELEAAEAEVARLQGGLNILVNCQSSLPRAAMREACAELLRGRTIGMANQSTAVRLVAAEAQVAKLTHERDGAIFVRNMHYEDAVTRAEAAEALVGKMRTALDDINKTAAQVAVDGGDSNEWLLKSIAQKAQAALAALEK